MQAQETKAAQVQTPSLPLMTRLARLAVYFGHQRLAWGLAIAATLVGAVTEPMILAPLQPLLDRGFTQGPCNCGPSRWRSWVCFWCAALRNLWGNTRSPKLPTKVLLLRMALFGPRAVGKTGLFSRQSASALSNTVVYEVQTIQLVGPSLTKPCRAMDSPWWRCWGICSTLTGSSR